MASESSALSSYNRDVQNAESIMSRDEHDMKAGVIMMNQVVIKFYG